MIRKDGFLNGKLLIAMPGIANSNLAQTVVYVCAHSREGAIGIILNQIKATALSDLLQLLGIIDNTDNVHLPLSICTLKLRNGGPIDPGRGFVLHSDDYMGEDTLRLAKDIYLTTTVDILHALSKGRGPGCLLVAMGYVDWKPGQLEEEINVSDWLTASATPDILFDVLPSNQYAYCLDRIGVDPMRFTKQAGRA